MKKILTIGDSFTNPRPPTKTAWPFMLHGEVHNFATDGASNMFIHRVGMEQISSGNYTHAVFGLSNWDRHETSSRDYYENKYENFRAIRPKIANSFGGAGEKYLQKYSREYYFDLTCSYIISLKAICKVKNVKFKFLQLLVPFCEHPQVEISDENFKNHFDDSLWDITDDDFIDFEFKSKSFTQLKTKNMNGLFTRSGNLNYQVGDYKGRWDFHPNRAGHSYIAEKVNLWL